VSLEAQRAKLRAYCQALDLELVDITCDNGASASTLKRSGLRFALSLLEAGKADALIVVKLDRLTRSVKDLGHLCETYFGEGKPWSLLSVADAIDTRSASGKLVLNVLMSVAQWEREAASERTRDALQQVKAEGGRLGQVEFGYRFSERLDSHGRRLVEIDPQAQEVLQRIVAEHDSGVEVPQIVKDLNQEGLKTLRGRDWHRVQVYQILRRAGRLPETQGLSRRKSRLEVEARRDKRSAAEVARALRTQGMSLRAIGRALIAQGLAPPRGGKWHASTLSTWLGYERP
jgi:DNA invertase Pin-like site-specific DNA recombinase